MDAGVAVVSSAGKSTVTKKKRCHETATHVHLQEKHLRSIPKVKNSQRVLVLYLYDNNISRITNLEGFSNLSSLYLQDNDIRIIENLQNLTNLKLLYLGRNLISVLENVNNSPSLSELYLEKQQLPDGMALCFDPRTLLALSDSLSVLNISRNNILSIGCLSILRNLRSIDVSHNYLDDIVDVCSTVEKWYYLEEASFVGNPITKKHRYKENIIAKSSYLETLDGKRISELTRKFLRSFEEGKRAKGSKHRINLADVIQGVPKSYPAALNQVVSANILRKSNTDDLLEDLSTFDEKDAVYLAWNALPKRRPYVANRSGPNRMSEALKSAVVVNSLQRIP